jgi:hypothetical protein
VRTQKEEALAIFPKCMTTLGATEEAAASISGSFSFSAIFQASIQNKVSIWA